MTIVASATQGGDASTCPPVGGAALQGLTVTFSTTTTGVAIAPSSSVTNVSGQAAATVVVPFGTQVAVVAAAGGAEATLLVPQIATEGPPIVFDTPSFVPSVPAAYLPTGQVFTLQTTARTAPNAGVVAGLTVAFATTTTGISFSPATFTTGESGAVEASVIIPYGTTVEAVVSGGGGDQTALATANALKVSPGLLTPVTPAIYLPGGEVYSLQVTAQVADGGAQVEGVAVAFATTTTGVVFSPASAPTNARGLATSNVVVPYGTELQVVVSGGGDVEAATTVGPAIGLHATSSPSSPLGLLPAGEVFIVTASATATVADGGAADTGMPIEGLPIAFATTTAGIAFAPSSVATNASGAATASVVVPYGAQIEAVVSGGGTAYALASVITAPAVTLVPRFVPQGADAGTCTPGMPCILQVHATMGAAGVPGLPVSIVITDLQSRIGDAGDAEAGAPAPTSITAPAGIVTDNTGTAEFAFPIPANVVQLTAAVAGGGSNQSAQWP